MENDVELRVVHALRLRSLADAFVVAERADVAVDLAQASLAALAEAGHAGFRDGQLSGWMLTPQGRVHGETLLAEQLDRAGHRQALSSIYQRFLEHNKPFLQLCTDWKVRVVDGQHVVNDNTDSLYDASIVARLADANSAIQPICADLASLFDRFADYNPRFTHALAKVQVGDTDWFTKPMIDSFHTVWFELHEDLLASLGIDRAREVYV